MVTGDIVRGFDAESVMHSQAFIRVVNRTHLSISMILGNGVIR